MKHFLPRNVILLVSLNNYLVYKYRNVNSTQYSWRISKLILAPMF